MAMGEKDLLALKKEIEGAKTKLSELKGQKDFLLKDLKEKWDCSTIEQAKTKVESLQDEIEELEGRILKEVDDLEREYQLL